jgi:V/A-type H+-transporting ATPase subunit I
MIVPLKHLTLFCVAETRKETLDLLREIGLVHLNLEVTDSDTFREEQSKLEAVQRALQILAAARADKPVSPVLSAPHRVPGHVQKVATLLTQKLPVMSGSAEERVAAIAHLADIRQELVNEVSRLERELERYTPFGVFDVTQPVRLAQCGTAITLFRAPLLHRLQAPEGALIETLATDTKHVYGVLIGPGRLIEPCEVFDLPEAGLDILEERRNQSLARIAIINDRLKRSAAETAVLDQHALYLADRSVFATAADTMKAHGAVLWITGWLPAEQEPLLRETAAEHAWGLLLREPAAGETVPTLLRPPRLVRPMLALFRALGITPAYHEADVSLPFFCFFGIFFAMLVGDGGYGALILLLTLYARKKFPRAPRSPFILLAVFSVATIVWGALSNTWFGFHPDILGNAVSRWLSQPGGKGDGHMMLLCFTLGVVHLSIARIWNAVTLFPDRKFLAQLGWLGVIWFMYFLAGSVVGVLTMPEPMKVVFGVSVALIALFMLRKDELKTQGADLGMLPLNIISCLGDIISYVRLFAVGLAGVKVAENFNAMALGLDLPMIVKIPCLILILLLGHALNFAMAGLSVLVHAVRLNTLEFSNHKGITWAGFAFKPFKRNVETP